MNKDEIISKLMEALVPFALAADGFWKDFDVTELVYQETDNNMYPLGYDAPDGERSSLKVRHLVEAAAVLKECQEAQARHDQ